MARRTGATKIRDLAKGLCLAVTFFTPIIKAVYGDRPTLMAALEATNLACGALVDEINEVLEQGD